MAAAKTTVIDHKAFIAELARLFPDVAADIDPKIDGGLLHLEMAAFSRFTNMEMKRGDRATLVRCFQFAERLLLRGDAAVRNAVHVSYVEHLDLESEQGTRARALMPSSLARAWADITAYNAELARDGAKAKALRGGPKRR